MNDLKRNSLSVIAILVMVFLFLAWQGYSRHRQFVSYHQDLASHSVSAIAAELSNLIESYRRLARLYAIQHQDTLASLLEQSNNPKSAAQLADSLAQFLPEFSDFALADAQGEPNFTLNSNNLAEPCRLQLLDFARSGSKQQPIKIHSDQHGSHFDIVTEFGMSDRTGLFFVSFNVQRLKTILKNGHIKGHQLQLLSHNHSMQETTAQVSRQPSNPLFSLFSTSAEAALAENPQAFDLSHSLAVQKITNTPWLLTDTAEMTLFADEKFKIILEISLIFLVFTTVALIILRLSQRQLRQTSEATLTIESIENERTRIAMDLHDQVLGEITHRIRETDSYLTSCEEHNRLHQQVSGLTSSLNSMSEGIRGIIDDLHPQALSILGLEATLSNSLEKRIQATEQLKWSLSVEQQSDQLLSAANQLNLYRILLELSQNVIRHAQAKKLTIQLRKHRDGKIRVRITDDGIGFNRNEISISSHGLANIRTRVRSMNGDIRWSSPDNGHGTCVQLDIPCTRSDHH